MKLTDQVISLDLAKRLRELGIGLSHDYAEAFYWVRYEVSGGDEWRLHYRARAAEDMYNSHSTGAREAIAAFTVAELGEMLPFSVEVQGQEVTCEDYKDDSGGWDAWFMNASSAIVGAKFTAHTEAEARGLMLAYLIENNLLTV